MSNKQKILSSALLLFNKRNLKSVTTNIIAKECGVSTGNLYYHFNDKEEIIRSLLTQMVESERKVIENCSEYSLDGLKKYFKEMLKVYWKYRFIKCEMMSIVSNDEIIKPMVVEYTTMHESAIKETVKEFINAKIMIKMGKVETDNLVKTIMLQLLFYIPFMEMKSKKINKKVFEECVDMIFSIIEPYVIK